MQSQKASFQFPVGHIHHYLKQYMQHNVWICVKAAVYTSNASKDLHVKYIMLRHLQLVIRGNEELNILVRVTIAGSGVLPFIHKSLTVTKTKKPEGQ
ncbi:hypothetical protein HD554DRAFT_2204939 [Boletus coccyginus]|nr:hypothetical protein HD554DRAFT_2204939 [Boletus coccyginus]